MFLPARLSASLFVLLSVFSSSGRVLSSLQPASAPAPPTAEWVARPVQDRENGRDGRLEMRMRLFDRQGRVRERALTLTSLEGGDVKTPKAPDGDRLLIRFTFPNDIKGTSFLVWEHPEGDDERFLFLP